MRLSLPLLQNHAGPQDGDVALRRAPDIADGTAGAFLGRLAWFPINRVPARIRREAVFRAHPARRVQPPALKGDDARASLAIRSLTGTMLPPSNHISNIGP